MTENTITRESDAQAIIAAVQQMYKPAQYVVTNQIDRESVMKMAVPSGMTLVDMQEELDRRAPAPHRAKGNIQVFNLDSFVAMVSRHKSDATVVYVNKSKQPCITAILNDNKVGQVPGWRDNQVTYYPQLSTEWKAWITHNCNTLPQLVFAEFLQDHILDIVGTDCISDTLRKTVADLGIQPGMPAEIMAMSKGLFVRVEQNVKEARNLDSGETVIEYTDTHNTSDSSGKPMSVKNGFIIAIPVFEFGPRYPIIVRLRYRIKERRIAWSYHMTLAKEVWNDAMQGMIGELREKLPDVLLVEGAP